MTIAINAGDTEEVLDFYTRVFGRGPDTAPMDDFLEWQICPGTWLQLSTGHDRPGANNARVRFEVADIDAAVGRMTEAKVPVGDLDPQQAVDRARGVPGAHLQAAACGQRHEVSWWRARLSTLGDSPHGVLHPGSQRIQCRAGPVVSQLGPDRSAQSGQWHRADHGALDAAQQDPVPRPSDRAGEHCPGPESAQ